MLVWEWMLPHGRTCQVVHSESMAVHDLDKGLDSCDLPGQGQHATLGPRRIR